MQVRNGQQTVFNGLIVSSSAQVTGSLGVTEGITGSLFGTASWSQFTATASAVVGGTQFRVPFFNTANSLSSSFLWQSGSVLTTILTGSEYGLKLDFGLNEYILGSGSNTVKAAAFDDGVYLSALNSIDLYTVGQNPTAFRLNDQTKRIFTQYSSSTYGLNLNFDTNTYQIGDFRNANSGSVTVTNTLVSVTKPMSITGGVTATNFTGSLFGTSSWAQNFITSSVTSASYAFTASSATNAFQATSASFAFTASSAVSAFTASSAISSSLSISSSFAFTASSAVSAFTASSAVNAANALTASSADNFNVRQSITASNALINGTITAQTLVVQVITSSTDFVTGSTRFGSTTANTHQFTGSVTITGSLAVTGRATVTDLTGSLFGTASWAQNFITSSVTSASYAFTASSATNAFQSISSSFAFTASSAISSSRAISSSFALTASFALNAGGASGFPFTGSARITGSLDVTGSVTATNFTGSLRGTASLATTASVALSVIGGFSKSFVIFNNNNIQANDANTYPSWRCNVACTASMVMAYTDSGSNVLVNATRNNNNLLASNLSVSSNAWVSSSTLQNQNFSVGDILGFTLVSFSGTPKEITIQTSFNY